jgi:hypothetical protein
VIAVHAILRARPCPQTRGSSRYVSSVDLEDGYGRTSTRPAYLVESSSKNHIPRPDSAELATLRATRRLIYSFSGGAPSNRYRIPTDGQPSREGRRHRLDRQSVDANGPQFVCFGVHSPFSPLRSSSSPSLPSPTHTKMWLLKKNNIPRTFNSI